MFRRSTRLYAVLSMVKSCVSRSRPTTEACRRLASVTRAISPKCCPGCITLTHGPYTVCGRIVSPLYLRALVMGAAS